MSRNIKRGAKLSDNDRVYLASRPGGVAAYEVERKEGSPATEEDFSTFSGDSDGGSGPVGEGEDPYLDWSVEDLREELKARELSTTGKKAELVARLEESDRAEAS